MIYFSKVSFKIVETQKKQMLRRANRFWESRLRPKASNYTLLLTLNPIYIQIRENCIKNSFTDHLPCYLYTFYGGKRDLFTSSLQTLFTLSSLKVFHMYYVLYIHVQYKHYMYITSKFIHQGYNIEIKCCVFFFFTNLSR